MRLICPNCDAQYEVPEEVIPPEGRDVQCSNCGQTWYQNHPDTLARDEAEAAAAPEPDEEVVYPEEDHAYEEDEGAPERSVFEEPEEPAFEAPVTEPDPEPVRAPDPEPEPAAVVPRRTVTPDVASVLREEAELETTARRKEDPVGLESQPDLGLTSFDAPAGSSTREDQARDRMARMRGETTLSGEEQMEQFRAEVAAAGGSRRDLLPDIEEINSTLRSNNDRSAGDAGQTARAEVREKRSSRRGFVLVVALFAILALIYAFAEDIGAAAPQLESALGTYTAAVDEWRVWLDGHVQNLLTWLDAAAGSGES